MPSIAIPKDKIKDFVDLPNGIYKLKLTGFKPSISKDKQSVNLNPILEVTDHGLIPDPKDPSKQVDVNGQRAFSNVNSGEKAFYILESFVHAFGLEMVDTGDSLDIPGAFDGPIDNPSLWKYKGPMLNEVIEAEVVMRENIDAKGVKTGKKTPTVNEFLCKVIDCDKKHASNLA